MFENYNRYHVVIYYDKETECFINWAKTFWLLKCPHPVKTLRIDSSYHKITSPEDWLNCHAKDFKDTFCLFVPATAKILLEIDLFADSEQNNRFGILPSGDIVICRLDPLASEFIKSPLDEVFEDLGAAENHQVINQEIEFMKTQLLMNV